MARPLSELQALLAGLDEVEQAYIQTPTTLQYPCIVIERDDSYTAHADNVVYFLKKRYTITIMDRNPDSSIPDQVEALPYSQIDRTFKVDGLNHTVFQLYF